MNVEKIGQVESCVAQVLESPLKSILSQFGYSVSDQNQLQIELHKGDRKTRSDAAADYWSPDAGWIKIYFVPKLSHTRQPAALSTTGSGSATQRSAASHASPEGAVPSGSYLHPAEADLLRALERAESTPGWSFVPLKKFRDEILPSQQITSMPTDIEQHQVLRSAIEKRFILVGKVPNPKAPQFPVSTIRLNRVLPEVQAALGKGPSLDADFTPIEIRGEPLSATILRERR
ncbi:MAG TPA: hypothetical protein VL240_08280 [Candidatus Binatia bacterium]|nr:hypothetical protein [Candidatus Binatia bacterium]